jgi:hypothetical protein
MPHLLDTIEQLEAADVQVVALDGSIDTLCSTGRLVLRAARGRRTASLWHHLR